MEMDKMNHDSLAKGEDRGELHLKIAQFSTAIELYKNNPWYSRFELLVSCSIVFFQMLSLYYLIHAYDGNSTFLIIGAFILSYLITDFINGIIHMYMDNNTQYSSIAGPFIAAFHLHHAKPKYTHQHPLKVYFFESGTKFWLLGYLFVLLCLQHTVSLPYGLNCCLIFTGILSSVAEVSHYWSHNASKDNKVIYMLQKYHLLLSKKHHINHHRFDNTHYAFLNGITDPLINIISRYYYDGYKDNADNHIAAYLKSNQNNNS